MRTKLSVEDVMTMSTEDIVSSFEEIDRMRSRAEERAGDFAAEKARIVRVVEAARRSAIKEAKTESERETINQLAVAIATGIEDTK